MHLSGKDRIAANGGQPQWALSAKGYDVCHGAGGALSGEKSVSFKNRLNFAHDLPTGLGIGLGFDPVGIGAERGPVLIGSVAAGMRKDVDQRRTVGGGSMAVQ